jgi:hypothetical protein
MSWSISLIGKADKIKEKLKAKLEAISKDSKDACRVEFEAALPHLLGLIEQNYVTEDGRNRGCQDSILHLEASGSGIGIDGVPLQRSVRVNLVSSYAEACF